MSPEPADRQPPIIDAHAHAFPDAVAEVAMPRLVAEALWMELHPSTDGTLGGLLGSMDRAGVRRAIVCSVATRPEQVRKITDWSVAIASERIVPFASIHPDFDEPEAEVERIAEAGLRGLKFHSQYMACPIDDPRTVRIARAAAEAGLAMTFHTGYDLGFEPDDLASPARVRRLHEAVPELRFCACHMGGWRQWEDSVEQVAGLPVYIETSYSIGQCPDDVLERIIDRHGDDYLMWGTDVPWADQATELERLRGLGLPPKLERAMLWDNAHRFAGVEPEA